ncbi:MAG: hypothetical protein K0R40_3017 [Burkholderiales bacterium]|jgi:hypothetical protein|nr:hypothetical protein [Burkholderiales bacterium]
MKRVLLINIAVLAALIVLFLGALEAHLRLTVPASSNETIYEYSLRTKRYKLMKANAAVSAWGKELRTNALGFRDRPVGPKLPGEYRIVVLGDSFTVSAGVDFDQIYTRRLEKLTGARVVNLAVGGYNIVQYALVLQEVGLHLEPDMVLVAVFPDNDFSNETYESNLRVASGGASPEPEQAWYESLYIHRAYGARVENKLRAMMGSKPDGAASTGWKDNLAALKAIAAIARERKLALEVVLLPHTWNFERQRPLFDKVQDECAVLGLECRSLLDAFVKRGVRESTLRLNPLDAHPNGRYNAIVAEALASMIERRPGARRQAGGQPLRHVGHPNRVVGVAAHDAVVAD